MEIYFEKENKTKKIELKKPTTLKNILDSEGIIIESVILVKNGEVCLEEVIIDNGDKIQILNVVSGG